MNSILSRICFICILFISLMSCSNEKQNDVMETDAVENSQENKLDELFVIPESTLTAEQLELKKKIEQVYIYHTIANGPDKMELDVGSDYFIENGIPVVYYDLLKTRLENNYEIITKVRKETESTHGVFYSDVAADIKDNKRQYSQYLNEVGSDSISYHEWQRRKAEQKYREMIDTTTE